jgi:hypothetical protein
VLASFLYPLAIVFVLLFHVWWNCVNRMGLWIVNLNLMFDCELITQFCNTILFSVKFHFHILNSPKKYIFMLS